MYYTLHKLNSLTSSNLRMYACYLNPDDYGTLTLYPELADVHQETKVDDTDDTPALSMLDAICQEHNIRLIPDRTRPRRIYTWQCHLGHVFCTSKQNIRLRATSQKNRPFTFPSICLECSVKFYETAWGMEQISKLNEYTGFSSTLIWRCTSCGKNIHFCLRQSELFLGCPCRTHLDCCLMTKTRK